LIDGIGLEIVTVMTVSARRVYRICHIAADVLRRQMAEA
jgi:hypothetical protein